MGLKKYSAESQFMGRCYVARPAYGGFLYIKKIPTETAELFALQGVNRQTEYGIRNTE
jgi:hypothetical protein